MNFYCKQNIRSVFHFSSTHPEIVFYISLFNYENKFSILTTTTINQFHLLIWKIEKYDYLIDQRYTVKTLRKSAFNNNIVRVTSPMLFIRWTQQSDSNNPIDTATKIDYYTFGVRTQSASIAVTRVLKLSNCMELVRYYFL